MIQISNVLHEAVQKFKDNTPLWLKDKCNLELEPQQLIYVEEIEKHNKSVIVEPPRAGKTVSVEGVCLKEIATNEKEKELCIGPAFSQSKNALKEQLDWIEGSPILKKMVKVLRGKPQISDTRYELKNHSGGQALSIGGRIDSFEASIIRGEEMDDMNMEIWDNRVIQRGGRKNKSGLPLRIRLSGTIQLGKGPLFQFINDPNYHTVTMTDIYVLIRLGIYDEEAIAEFKSRLTSEQWLRIFLLKFVDAKNFIWEARLHKCLMKAIKIGWQGVEYDPSSSGYNPTGVVYCGFDCGHSGEGKIHSVYRLDFIEVIGDQVLWLNAFEWEATEDPDVILKDHVKYWAFYKCSSGYADALKSAQVATINDALFYEGLIQSDRSEYPENKPAHWHKWDFAPVWNTGKFKYMAGSITRIKVENVEFIVPYYDIKDERHIAKMSHRLRDAMLNIREEKNLSTYPSLTIIRDEIGDDPFDSINMAVGCANDRAIVPVDLSRVGFSEESTVTSGLNASVIRELESVGGGMSFGDFGVN